MKIGIDISQIVYGTGVSVYTQNLIENLRKIDKKNEYLLFGGSLRQKEKLQNYGAKVFSFPPTLADFVWNRLHLLPVENFLGPIDVFHSSDWTQPPTKAAKVTTIHDFGFLKYPQVAHPKIKAVMMRRFKWIKQEIDLIIAVSEATKKDIVEILNIPNEKIRVVYEAASENINQVKDKKIIERIKNKYGIKGDYLLSVATLEPRKNLKRIIEAFNLLNIKDLSLVIVGKSGWDEEINKWGFKNKDRRIIFTGYVEQNDLSSFYSGAKCFVFPSFYEGFGLPILEAMKCGCPVVTSNLSSMPEVAGEAGILVEPLDIKKIANGVKQAMENRQELIKKGFEQSKKFSWEKTAEQTLKVYKEAFEQ